MNGELPTVSVILAAHNEARAIGKTLETIFAQDYPTELIEVVVVDNNSTDDTVAIASRHPVRIVAEREHQSCNAARNRGIREARGEIVAITDAHVAAHPGWIRAGVRALFDHDAELAGGKIVTPLDPRHGLFQHYPTFFGLDQEALVAREGFAAGGNLFVRKRLFDRIGLFSSVRHVDDIEFGHRATRSGAKIVYAADAVIEHGGHAGHMWGSACSRLRAERIGGGVVGRILREERGRYPWRDLLSLLDPRPCWIGRKAMADRSTIIPVPERVACSLLKYLCNLSRALGIVQGAGGAGLRRSSC